LLPTQFEQTEAGAPVPTNSLLQYRYIFKQPPKLLVSEAFRRVHEISEALYRGNGIWDGTPLMPLVRFTSRRVIGYISAYRALGDDIYLTRAREGLEYLLAEQKPSGTFVWYHRSIRGIDNREDGLYETAIAGYALLEGYRLFGNPQYLHASEKAAKWEMDCPISRNTNYNMFAVWHLAALYRETNQQVYLECAIHKTKEGGIPGQLESGGWPGHNSWTWYHGIIIRGMAELHNILPENHSFRPELQSSLTAAINRLIREQEITGHIPANLGIKDEHHRMAHPLHGLITARESFGNYLDNCIYGIEQYRIATEPTWQEVQEFKQARSKWLVQSQEAKRNTINRKVWFDGFEHFVKDPDWGDRAEGWFNCWYPLHDPVAGQIRWVCNSKEQKSGKSCLEYTAIGPTVFSGVGFKIPGNLLKPGDAYRFEVWVKCRESDGAKGCINLVYISVYSGSFRDRWDCLTDCKIMNEEPSFNEYSKLSVQFTAMPDTTYLYVYLQADSIPPGETVSMFLDDAELFHEGKPIPEWMSPLKYEDWDCDLMVTGVYLERMFRRGSSE
jgi:hypothetical protein